MDPFHSSLSPLRLMSQQMRLFFVPSVFFVADFNIFSNHLKTHCNFMSIKEKEEEKEDDDDRHVAVNSWQLFSSIHPL